MKIQSLKGMRDILPPEVYVWQYIEGKARKIFEIFGYEEIRTPILEETALFQKSIGEGTDIVTKEMYTFTDRGGRSVTLRPEGTAPIVRSYIENRLDSEDFLKLYYIGPMFRSERPQKGRARQFYQIGAEAIGSQYPYIDAGLIYLMARFFRELGLEGFKIKLCSLGCAGDKEKLAAALRRYLSPEKSRLCQDCKVRLKKNVLRTLDCKVESCRSVMRNSPKAKDYLCPSCTEGYNKIKDLLKIRKVDFTEDPNMVRGLDYYTGTVFEVTHPSLGAQDAIAAGGRYDNLIGDFGGKSTPAIGFAVGMERLIMALPEGKKKKLQEGRNPALYAATTGKTAFEDAEKTIEALREEGILCEINFDPARSLKSQMRQANRKKAAFVAIFGDEELKRGDVALRNMKTSEQKNVKLSELAEEIKKGL